MAPLTYDTSSSHMASDREPLRPPPSSLRSRKSRQSGGLDAESVDTPRHRTPSIQRNTSGECDRGRSREGSPYKSLRWKRNLELGPTKSTADHRHQSPQRSALRREDDGCRTSRQIGRRSTTANSEPSVTAQPSPTVSEAGAMADAQLRREMRDYARTKVKGGKTTPKSVRARPRALSIGQRWRLRLLENTRRYMTGTSFT